MHMRANRKAALAGWVSQALTGAQERAGLHPVAPFDVQIKHHPTALFISVAVQVQDHDAICGSQHQAIGNGCHPGIVLGAVFGFARRTKIQGGPGGAVSPGGMRPAREGPDCAGFERQLHGRLG